MRSLENNRRRRRGSTDRPPSRTAAVAAARSARGTTESVPGVTGLRGPPSLAGQGATATARSTSNPPPHPTLNPPPRMTSAWVTAGSAPGTGRSTSGRSCIAIGRGERRRGREGDEEETRCRRLCGAAAAREGGGDGGRREPGAVGWQRWGGAPRVASEEEFRNLTMCSQVSRDMTASLRGRGHGHRYQVCHVSFSA
jgi:hypothetical protein